LDSSGGHALWGASVIEREKRGIPVYELHPPHDKYFAQTAGLHTCNPASGSPILTIGISEPSNEDFKTFEEVHHDKPPFSLSERRRFILDGV
jgi:hypothetical protein